MPWTVEPLGSQRESEVSWHYEAKGSSVLRRLFWISGERCLARQSERRPSHDEV
jgi:hypothetical protein